MPMPAGRERKGSGSSLADGLSWLAHATGMVSATGMVNILSMFVGCRPAPSKAPLGKEEVCSKPIFTSDIVLRETKAQRTLRANKKGDEAKTNPNQKSLAYREKLVKVTLKKNRKEGKNKLKNQLKKHYERVYKTEKQRIEPALSKKDQKKIDAKMRVWFEKEEKKKKAKIEAAQRSGTRAKRKPAKPLPVASLISI